MCYICRDMGLDEISCNLFSILTIYHFKPSIIDRTIDNDRGDMDSLYRDALDRDENDRQEDDISQSQTHTFTKISIGSQTDLEILLLYVQNLQQAFKPPQVSGSL